MIDEERKQGYNMNIFYLDKDIEKSVQYLHDAHVVKMCLESTQILCIALNEMGYKTPYKSTHIKHPCLQWVIKSEYNLIWMVVYTIYLCTEYTIRFNKQHKCELVIKELFKEIGALIIISLFESLKHKRNEIIDKVPPQCMPDEYKEKYICEYDTIIAYRNYYNGEKLFPKGKPAKWTGREIPYWIDKEKLNIGVN